MTPKIGSEEGEEPTNVEDTHEDTNTEEQTDESAEEGNRFHLRGRRRF